jgi:hypothetical protein
MHEKISIVDTNYSDLELSSIKKEVYLIAHFIKKTYSYKYSQEDYEYHNDLFGNSLTSVLWTEYNVFNFKQPLLNNLLKKIKQLFVDTYNPTTTYFISAWINIHKKNDNLKWHSHWGKDTFHGYFALKSEPSTTSYKFEDEEEIYVHTNKNGLLLMNRSEGNRHCVSKWNEDFDRITLAFDIIPFEIVIREGLLPYENNKLSCNRFLPFYIKR